MVNEKIAALLGRMGADAQHVIYQVEYQRAVRTQIQAILEQLQADEFETVSEYLTKSYEDGFVGAMYSLHNQGMPFIFPIDQAQVVKAIQHDTHLTSSLYTALGLDLAKLRKTISHEISRGIASNMLYPEITGNVSRAAGIPLRRARTIVRTEAGRIQEQATMDAAEKAVSKGADLVKQWSAIRDGKTRDTHRSLDGQIREIEEPFEVGGKTAMQPHGFGIASEDCNCRCTTLLRARDALDEEEYERLQGIARQHGLLVDDSKKYGHDKAKDFADFKKKYLRASETLEKSGKTVYNNSAEMLQKSSDARKQFKFISDERFDQLTIEARKHGAMILRGTPEVEKHLESMNASASTLGDALLFKKDVCICEVLEETRHFMQNLQGMNDDKNADLRLILNEIEAKEYVIKSATKYKVPRNEVELMEEHLAYYRSMLAEYEKGGE